MKVLFRVDSSLEIGTGHVMRCLTLAMELKSRGCEVVFICRDLKGNLSGYISSKDYRVVLLTSESNKVTGEISDEVVLYHEHWLAVSWRQDAEETKSALANEKDVDWLVVDHYGLDIRWERHLKDVVKKILVIDDLADRKHEADLLLDQNFYHDLDVRYENLVASRCKLLLGPKYSLLRNEFQLIRKNMEFKERPISKILVFFGGVDAENMTGKVLLALKNINLETLTVNVVIGASNQHRKELEAICSEEKSFYLKVQVENMAELMSESDLSIGAGGSTTWERFCLGLPSLVLPIAENQKQLLKDCAREGLLYMPDYKDKAVDEIHYHVKAMIDNSALCAYMREKGALLVDGKGVQRVSNLIVTPKINLVEAKEEDVLKIYKWRNEPDIREMSHSKSEIDIEEHKQWFGRVLNDSNRFVLIASIFESEIGVVRFDISGIEAEVSIYLLGENKGKGYGTEMLKAAEYWLVKQRPEIKSVVADVINNNKASMSLFNSNGYTLDTVRYIKSLENVF